LDEPRRKLKLSEMMKRHLPTHLTLLALLLAGLGVPAASSYAQSPAKKKTQQTSSRRGKSAKRTTSRRDKGQKAPTVERVSEIQRALAKDGSFAGTPNGKWDDTTVASMKKFQAGHGLNPSGKLDAKTLQQLGLGSQTAGMGAPTPPVRISSASRPPTESIDRKQ
jgi:peptidoglycan hydrolase-like protein with peptidoglycan-binding domain